MTPLRRSPARRPRELAVTRGKHLETLASIVTGPWVDGSTP
jgi:hypothetical protein